MSDQEKEADDHEGQAEVERIMSRMFGHARQDNSQEEQTRHVGVVFRNLTVKGTGLGAALQPTVGDIFAGLPRALSAKIRGQKSSKPPVRKILNNMTGAIRPGEMLLVLGRPGSGCTTFLKVLGNQRAAYTSIDGTVSYGGTDAATMGKEFRGEVVYNPEDDLHYATLSVKRTLEFALKTRTPGKESRLEGESRSSYVAEFLTNVTKLFWIAHTLNTFVGDERVRGISGGERKRVSIAEALITRASTQMWDNSTRGLDASTALEYVQSIRSLTNMAGIATAVALYQAGESLYGLFDKVLLLDGGRCCYYGATADAVAYFEGLGFVRQPHWTSADFLTSVTDRHARHVRPGMEREVPASPDEFEALFHGSAVARASEDDVKALEETFEAQRRQREERTTKATKKKNYTLPFHRQVAACTQRQFFVLTGDKQSLGGKWCGLLFLALITGSLFYNLGQTSSDVFQRGGVMFFMLLFNSLVALAEISGAFAARPILMKHKTFSFYRPSAYAIAQVVVDLLLVAVQVFIFDIVVYFMSGLQRTPSQFFISLLVLYIQVLAIYSYFRCFAAWCGSLDVATRFTGLSIQAMTTYTGYMIPPDKMHPWFSWIRWINPIAYGFESLMANEFYDLTIECVPPMLVPQGPMASPAYQSCTLQGSQPGTTTVNGADYIKTAYSYSRDHLWRNVGIVIGMWLFFVALTALGMERQKPNAAGGAVTVFKRGKAPKAVEEALVAKSEKRDPDLEAAKSPDSQSTDVSSGKSENDATPTGIAQTETVFTFQNINYTIPYEGGTRQLLRNVNGYVRPGRLTALMGASGAGKTTLLNTLAQRINFGVVSGDFLVDGQPLPKSFQRNTGFAEQMDIHDPTATVREAFRFSALLRRPKSVPIEEKYDYVEKIIDLLEMRDIAGAIIGKVGSGLPQEQRKRVTIGVELAAKPELLLFLDEPTSGLDSQAAFNIIRFLRKLADAGQAILCTIHQPSSILFEQFDELLLLKSGGRVVYNGPLGSSGRTLINYFQSHGAKECSKDANPAEYMLECVGAGDPNYKGPDWGDIWQESDEHTACIEEIHSLTQSRRRETQPSSTTTTSGSNSSSSSSESEYAMPSSTQIVAVTKRQFVAIWRSPDYIIGKVALHVVTGLFTTFTFYQLGHSSVDMQSRLFTVFITFTIAPPLMQQLQPRYLAMRAVYAAREASARIYGWPAFVVGALAPELPYALVAGTLYFAAWYWGNGFRAGWTAATAWLFLMLFEMFYVGLGMAIASVAPNDLLASLLIPVFFIFVVAFCGVVVPYVSMPHFWKSWMYWLSPFHYLLEGIVGTVVHDIPVVCESKELAYFSPPPGLNCNEYTQSYIAQAGGYVQNASNGMCAFCQYSNGDEFARTFNIYYDHRWRNYGIFFAFVLFNFFMVFFGSWLYLGGARKIRGVFSRSKTGKKAGKKNSNSSNDDDNNNNNKKSSAPGPAQEKPVPAAKTDVPQAVSGGGGRTDESAKPERDYDVESGRDGPAAREATEEVQGKNGSLA